MANDELVFVCIQCGHGCSSYEDLTNHMEDHEDQKPDIRQLRKSTVFGKGKCSGKFGKGGKKVDSSINDDFKTESDGQLSRMYSYPSYISIGTNNLDDIDPTWSQGNDFGNRKDIEPGRPKDMAAKTSTKGTSKNKQVQGKQTNKNTSKQTPTKKIANKQQTSKQAQNKQASSKQAPTMKTPSKQAQTMKLQTVKTIASTNGQKNKMATASKKLVSNKRKAAAEVVSGLKNAKLKKGETKAKKAEAVIQDVRRRSTNSMRLRRMTSAGEICHDDSSESMSESEKLAEAIRRSKIETSMTNVEKETLEKNGTSNGSIQNRTKDIDFDKFKGKKNDIGKALTKGKHSSAEKFKQSVFGDKKNRFIGTNKEHFIGHFKTNQKKAKKLFRTKNELPSMVLTKKELTSYRESKSNATVKRSAVATSKAAPTTLIGKIIPIQAPMMWKLVNSSQQQQPDAIDLKKIQSMKNNATLKFTGEQKVLITFNQNNDNPSSSGVKTIIANVTSPSKESTKSPSGVKTRQAVLLPLSVVGDAPNAAEGQMSKLADGSRQPVRILRSNTKSVSTISNYSIIPLSSLIASTAVVSSIPHLLSVVQKNAKSSVDTQMTSSSQKPISSPAKADTTTVGAVSQNTIITTQVSSPMKLVVVNSIASSSVKVTTTTLQALPTATLPKASTFATAHQTSIVASSVQASTSPSIPKQAFLPQSSKTLIIKHSANNPQVFTLIPTAGQQLLPRTTNQIGPNATNSGTVTSTVTQSQLIRPIFIAAQPTLMPQKTVPGANKSGAVTPTTQQAVFIAAGPINQGSSQSAAGIQLTLSPSKSLLAGAIPVIVGPQMAGGSAANLSSQIQLALSQLQCQNLTATPAAASGPTVSTTGLQTKTIAAVSQSIGVRSDGQSVTVIKAVSSSKMMPTILRRNPNTSASQTSLSGSSAVRKIVFPQESPAKGLVIKESPVIITTTASKRQTRQSVQRSEDIVCSTSDAVAAQINAVNPSMARSNDDTSCELQLPNKTTDIPEKEDLLSGMDGSKQCVTSEQYNKSPGPGIFDYLPTLPGACTTPVTPVMKSPVTEKLLVQIPLSKLSRKPVMSRLLKESGAHGANVNSPEKDLADIRKIIQHTASFELPFPSQNALINGKINNTSIATLFPSTVEAAYQPFSHSVLSTSQSGLPLQKFVQILPAASQKIIMTSVASSLPTGGSALIPNLSVINTPALRTPIVTPVVTSATAAPVCMDFNKTVPKSIPDRLQVSIKLASISSGTRLKNSKPINVVPAISQIPVGIKANSLPTPLLPRPTQGFLTLLAPKPTATLANQMQATATVGNLQRFPLTYLTTVPLQIGNRPRAQVMIQPTQRGIVNASFASTPPTASAPTNIRFGTQTMVIPVSLSIPGMNIQQVPVTSNILFSSLYPVVPASSLIQTQVRPKACVNVVPSQTLIHANSGNVTRLQKIAPYPSSSVSVKLAISKGLTINSKPVSAKPNVIGGSGIEDGQDSSIVDATTVVNSSLFPVETRVSSEEPSSKPENSIETIQSTAATIKSHSILTSSAETGKETSSSNAESLTTTLAALSNDCVSKQDTTTTPCEDGIVSFTNTLRSLLKADISEGSTVTINIQGNPVTYALKDGKLFSMPHDKPTKVEKNESKNKTADQKKTDDKIATSSEASSSEASSSEASSSEASSSEASSSRASTALQSTVTSSVTTCAGTSHMQSSTNLSFCNTTPISSNTVQSSISLRRKSDLPAPCSRLVVSVPKSLLLRKIRPFRSVSADLPSVEICEPHVQISKQTLNDAISNVTNVSSSIAERSPAVTSVVSSNSNIVANETTTPENSFPCKIENKRSSSDIEERKSENSEENGENGVKQDNFDLTFGFECDFCSDKFASYNLMWRHRKLHLNDTANFSSLHRTSLPRALCPKFAVCERCNKVFQSTSDLEKHKLTDNCGNSASQVIPNENFNTLEPVSSSAIGFTQHASNSLGSALSSSNSNHIRNDVINNETSNRGSHGTEIDTNFDMDSFQLDPQPPHVHNGTNERVDDQSLGRLLSDLTSDLIGSTAPAGDLGTDVIGNMMGSFDLNANFDDQVFEENVDVKPDLKPAKRMRRPSGKPGTPRKRILSRKHSNPGKIPLSNKRNRKRSRVTISDDEETFDDGGLDLDGEFITVGKLHGEFTCSRCDLGFQNEKELDEHNETFHDSLRYNFRERRSVTNLDYLDEFEFDFD